MRGLNALFRDVILLLLIGFLAVLIIMLPHLQEKGAEDSPNAGSIVVEVIWDANHNADVDTYFLTPDGNPISYQRKQNDIANLLKDDVGFRNEISDAVRRNDEYVYVRQVIDGHYALTFHWYGNYDARRPQVIVAYIVHFIGESRIKIAAGEVTLTRVKQEKTAIQFDVVDGEPNMLSKSDEQIFLVPSQSGSVGP